MHRFTIHSLTVQITDGDIAAADVDAVVNAANSALWMGSGVAGALKRAGGSEIEAEAMKQGPIRPGEAVITSGGRLPARHVIHAAAMGEDLETGADLIRAATSAAIDLAERHHLTSIAFPALGTGVGGFPVRDCAHVMLGVFRDRGAGLESVSLITMVLFGTPARDAFVQVATQVLGAPRS
jgi:O-acetyl-ADP-ribose deacetylase